MSTSVMKMLLFLLVSLDSGPNSFMHSFPLKLQGCHTRPMHVSSSQMAKSSLDPLTCWPNLCFVFWHPIGVLFLFLKGYLVFLEELRYGTYYQNISIVLFTMMFSLRISCETTLPFCKSLRFLYCRWATVSGEGIIVLILTAILKTLRSYYWRNCLGTHQPI